MVPPASRRIPRVLRYSGIGSLSSLFIYTAFTFSGCAFQRSSSKLQDTSCRPATLKSMLLSLGSSNFARRYFRNRFFFLFLRVLRCFSSPGSRSAGYVFTCGQLGDSQLGFPIRTSRDLCLLAAPPCFSQLATSFFGAWCLGIHPVLFSA